MSLVRDPKIEAALMLRKGIEQYGKVDFPLVGAAEGGPRSSATLFLPWHTVVTTTTCFEPA
jgi:hypothetical protein